MRRDILEEKLETFVAPRMDELGVTQWLILTREGRGDPVAASFHAGHAVGRMAVALTRMGRSVEIRAVCASYDVAPLEEADLYAEIDAYGAEGWRAGLTRLLGRAGQGRIAINVSSHEPIGDGLSCSLRGELVAALGEGGERRLVSSEPLLRDLFSRKTAWEIGRIEQAAVEAERLLRWALDGERIHAGKTTEAELAQVLAREVERHGLGFGWEPSFCPSVQFGTTRGHAAPGDRTASRGEIAVIDFGVAVEGYVSDLQRTLFLGTRAEIPANLARLWETTHAAVTAAARVLRPGATGLDVDTAARDIVTRAGYPEYEHATGHPLGYVVHDIGPMLGPDWPGRYGDRVHQRIEAGMVFTLEPAAAEPTGDGALRAGLEEDLVVEPGGARFLSPPQTALWTIER